MVLAHERQIDGHMVQSCFCNSCNQPRTLQYAGHPRPHTRAVNKPDTQSIRLPSTLPRRPTFVHSSVAACAKQHPCNATVKAATSCQRRPSPPVKQFARVSDVGTVSKALAVLIPLLAASGIPGCALPLTNLHSAVQRHASSPPPSSPRKLLDILLTQMQSISSKRGAGGADVRQPSRCLRGQLS